MLTSQSAEHTIAAVVHGRFLVRNGPPQRLLVGFHGYAQNAEIHLDNLLRIPGIDAWSVASVQALHPFYAGRTQQVVANWMTRQNRELAIADNLAYVQSVIESLHAPETIVFAGFSQGAAMAYRAAAAIPSRGVIAAGGDVPPDVIANLPPALVGRGVRDEWYTSEQFEKDLKVLESITRVTTCTYDGAHEWTDEFCEAAARFLTSCLTAPKS